jgi:hypothetical protein
LNIEDLTVEIRNEALVRIAQIPEEILNVTATWGPRATGTWQITLPVGSEHAEMLRVPGSGVVISYKGDELVSGPTSKPEIEYKKDDVAGSITFNGITDSIYLRDYLVYPQPSNINVETQNVKDWTMTGPAESIMHTLVCANIGPGAHSDRRVSHLTMGVDGEAGDTITVKARWSKLDTVLSKIAIAHKINYRIIQRADQLVFETRQADSREDDVRLSVANGSLSSIKVSYSPPEITHAIVGGKGSGTSRMMREYTTSDSEAAENLWNRRIERFIDQAGSDEESQLKTAALKDLNSKGATEVLSQAIPLDGDQLNFLDDWQVGDFVTADIEGQELSSEVSGGVLSATKQKVSLGVTLGNPLGFDPLAKKVYSGADQVDSYESVTLDAEVPIEVIEATAATVEDHTTTLSTHATEIADNTSDIAANTVDIATNTSDIATNTSDISALQSQVVALQTDGDAPATSPTPVLEAFAVGILRWSVPPTSNPDPTRRRVYADTIDPPTIDADHLVYDGASLSGTFDTIDGTRVLPADSTVTPPTVYVACIEYDDDGDGPTSATSNGAIARRASVAEISSEWVYAGSVQAGQIASGSILTGLLNVGAYIEQDGEDSTITIYSNDGNRTPLVQLRPDGSVFRGRVEANDISVLVGLILQGTDSHVAQSAGVTLDASVKDPATGPTLTSAPITSSWPAVPSGYESRGFSWDGTQWLRLIWKESSTTAKVEKINTSGVVTSTTTLSNTTGGTNMNSIVKVGSNWFTLYQSYDADAENNVWILIKYSTAGSRVAYTAYDGDPWSDSKRPSLGTDGTNILISSADGSGTIKVQVWDTSLIFSAEWSGTFAHANTAFSFVGKDNFDFGANRIVVTGSTSFFVFTLSGTTLTEATDKFVTLTDNTYDGGFGWDGTNFFSAGAGTSLRKYSAYYAAASEKAWVTYADTDTGSSKHTKDSTQSSLAVANRRYLSISLPPAPSGAATPRVYMGLATSSPADTALLKRAETITGRTLTVNPAVAGGVALVRTASVTNKARTGTTVTLSTSAAHGLEVGDTAVIAGVDAALNGTYVLTTGTTGSTLKYETVASGTIASASASGTATNTDTNTFGTGTAAWVKSQTGGLEFYGDGVAYLPGLKVYSTKWSRTSDQTLANGTATTITLPDTPTGSNPAGAAAAFYSYSSGTITINKAGLYRFEGYIEYASNATGYRRAGINLNGSRYAGVSVAPALSSITRLMVTATIQCAVGDLIVLEGNQSQSPSASLAVQGAHLQVTRVGEVAA